MPSLDSLRYDPNGMRIAALSTKVTYGRSPVEVVVRSERRFRMGRAPMPPPVRVTAAGESAAWRWQRFAAPEMVGSDG